MKRVLWIVLMMAGLAQAHPAAALSFGPFGELILRGQNANPALVVVLLSDAEGWGTVEEAMARIAAKAGALVIGVDCQRYFTHVEATRYEPNVSNELANMSKYVQKTLGLPALRKPVLLGHGAGAGVAYASLVQAPAWVFAGAVTLGFRPEVPLSQPFGWGRGLRWTKTDRGVRYEPFSASELPWTMIQAEQDPVFAVSAAREFVRGMSGVRIQELTGQSGYRDEEAWGGLFDEAVRAAGATSAPIRDAADLPLIEVRPRAPLTDTLAVFVTGDGGWAGIDKDIAAVLANNGIGVVGLDSLRYFWTKRTPEEAGADLARIMRHYLAAWDLRRVVCIGFSLGADALPSMVANLPAELRAQVRQLTLLAPSKYVELEFHVSDWLHDDEANQDIALLPVVRGLAPLPLLCVYGSDETSSLCSDLDPGQASIQQLPGSHHFNGDYARVAELILEHLNATAP